MRHSEAELFSFAFQAHSPADYERVAIEMRAHGLYTQIVRIFAVIYRFNNAAILGAGCFMQLCIL